MTDWETADVDDCPALSVEQPVSCLHHDYPTGRNELIYLQRFERVIAAMTRRLDLPMTNNNMADIACLSPCHFNRLFRHAAGIPPVQFHYALRLDHAKRLLISTDLSITDICFEVGYNSLGTFTSRFSQLVGLSPSAFRHLARAFLSARLSDFSGPLLESANRPASLQHICGEVSGEGCDGLVFLAIFPRAIPEGVPAACALTTYSGNSGFYSLPNPGCGVWHIFAVAVPWATVGVQLFTLDHLQRGRTGPIRVDENGWSGNRRIELASARMLDPPILSAIPILVRRLFAEQAPHASLLRSSMTSHDASMLI